MPKSASTTTSASAICGQRRAEPAGADLADLAVEAAPRVEVGARVGRHARRVAEQVHDRLGAAREQVPRDDEPVAAVVAGAAHDDDACVGGVAVEQLANEDVGRAAAGVLHQDQARHAARLDGVGVEGAHLRARQDRDHAVTNRKSGDRSQMIAAKHDFDRYNSEMNSYLDCLKLEMDAATPKDPSKLSADEKKKADDQQKILVQKNNAAVDELQAVVGRFNEQLKIFKAKQKPS